MSMVSDEIVSLEPSLDEVTVLIMRGHGASKNHRNKESK